MADKHTEPESAPLNVNEQKGRADKIDSFRSDSDDYREFLDELAEQLESVIEEDQVEQDQSDE